MGRQQHSVAGITSLLFKLAAILDATLCRRAATFRGKSK
jgi:hypothetical protein